MRTDTTRQPLSVTVVLFVLLTGVFLCRAVVAPYAAEQTLGGHVALGSLMARWLGLIPGATELSCLGMLLLDAFLITRLATRNMLHVTRTFMSMVFFSVVTCGLWFTPGDATAMAAVTLFIFATYRFLDAFRRRTGFSPLFAGALMLGLMPLFCPVSVVLWVAAPAALLLFMRCVREAVVCIAGLFLPLGVYSYIIWLGGGEFTRAAREICSVIAAPSGTPVYASVGQVVLLSLLVLVVFLSIGAYIASARTMRTRASRIFAYFICVLVAALCVLILPSRSVAAFQLAAPAVAIVAPLCFVRRPGLFTALLYWAVIVCSLGINILAMVVR